MRLLFEMDTENYDLNCGVFSRPSVRGIILRGDKIALIHSQKYDYYAFPGGGIERGERIKDALAREVREEAGLKILPETVRTYGYVHRFQRGRKSGMDVLYIQDNLYCFCEVKQKPERQKLDHYEAEEGFTLEWVDPEIAIEVNRRSSGHGPKNRVMLEREAKVLELLIKEGYFEQTAEEQWQQ